MTSHFQSRTVLPQAAVSLALVVLAAPVSAQEEFDEAFIFFELNNTDGDLGIHGKIDGGPWRNLTIRNDRSRRILGVRATGDGRRQGITEFFFESAEPTFDELSPEEFFERFEEGTYEIKGRSIEGERLESGTEVTHTMPAPAEVFVNGEAAADNCDDEDPGFNATEVVAPVTISWNDVTMSHPDLGTMPPVPVTIHNYEVVVETDLEIDGEEFTTVMHAVVPPGETSMTIPPEFLAQSDEFKYELLAREESYNQTAIESCFVLD